MQASGQQFVGERSGRPARRVAIPRTLVVGLALAGLIGVLSSSPACAQYPPARIPDIQERSGLVMRFAGTPELLPPIPAAIISTTPGMPTAG